MIELKNIKTVLDTKIVHNNINLTINKGETKVILGGSGSGKSVLIKVINKLIIPDSGEVNIENQNILKMKEKDFFNFRKKMSVLFQGAALFDSLSVLENVAFPLRRFTQLSEEEIIEAVYKNLGLVGLDKDIVSKYPAELSGGMAKRVGLARAVVMNPEYIFYDEPTTGTDPLMSGIINDLIIKLKDEINATSIVVTHDMESAFKVADNIAMIYDGNIIFDGTPEEIKESDNIHIKKFINGEAEELPEKLELL
ncbi:MAG: ABC transporter ATP-binding protein [Spirochaetota bacterium]